MLVFEQIKVKHYAKAVKLLVSFAAVFFGCHATGSVIKLYTNSIYPGLYLQDEDEGKNVSCIDIHVKHIEVSCLMVEVNNCYLKWRRMVQGFSAREKKVLLYSVRLCCIYWRYTVDQGWRNGGRTRFPTVWPVREIVLEGISGLVEFVGSGL